MFCINHYVACEDKSDECDEHEGYNKTNLRADDL